MRLRPASGHLCCSVRETKLGIRVQPFRGLDATEERAKACRPEVVQKHAKHGEVSGIHDKNLSVPRILTSNEQDRRHEHEPHQSDEAMPQHVVLLISTLRFIFLRELEAPVEAELA